MMLTMVDGRMQLSPRWPESLGDEFPGSIVATMRVGDIRSSYQFLIANCGHLY